jgi:DNA-directed DNA polymerase III PolC
VIRTSYSFRHAYGSPKDAVARLKEIGWTDAPLADTTVFGYDEWSKAATDAGLKPIFGATIAVTPSLNAKKPVVDGFTFLANESIQPVNLLISKATAQFRYVPQLTYADIANVEGVYKIAGYRARLDELDPADENLFIGLSVATPKGFVREAQRRGFRFIAHQENRYAAEDQRYDYETACGRGASLQTYPQHILSDEEWTAAIEAKGLGDLTWVALRNRMVVFDNCNATLPKASLIDPKPSQTLRELCEEGAKELGVDLSNPVYAERLDTELKVIADKKFDNYFHLLSDLLRWARREMLVGPGRGSSAGSLVCYLLRITEVDPIPHGLLFWRFIDPNRPDYPDIDTDFSATERDQVIEYLKQKYGADRVAKIGAVSMWQSKNAMNETAKAMGVSKYETTAVIGSVTKYAAGDSRSDHALQDAFDQTANGKAFLQRHPEMAVAGRLGGNPSHSTTHAAGLILTNEPLSLYVAMDARTQTAQIDGPTAEKRGAIKLDALGLTSLSIFQDALRLAGLPVDHLSHVPLDDPAAFDVLNKGHFCSLFQFDGRALQNLTREVHVSSLYDISTLSALARPGPLNSGAASSWVKRKNGREEVTYVDPRLEPYLKPYLGLLIMQESVMLIARELAGLDWNAVAALRKAIGKSMGPEAMRAYGDPFREGLIANGFEPETANRLWQDILGFGGYGFNLSHSIAYATVSYWSCWLKAHYPLEFAAAALTHQDDSEKQIALLRELAQEGVSYVPIDAEQSTDQWRVGYRDGRKVLVGPLSNCIGLGPKMQQSILSARARGEALPDRAAKLLAKAETKIDSLWPIADAIRNIDLAAKGIQTKPIPIGEYAATDEWEEDRVVVGVVTVCKERDENEPQRIEDRLANGREGRMSGKTAYLEMRVSDDSGTLLCKVGRNDFDPLGKSLLDKVREGHTIIACKGTCPPEISMMLVKQARILGELK